MIKTIHRAKLIGKDSDGNIYHYRGWEICSYKAVYGTGMNWSYGPIGEERHDAQNTLRDAKIHIDMLIDMENNGVEMIRENNNIILFHYSPFYFLVGYRCNQFLLRFFPNLY